MKKLTAMLLALTLCFGLAACGGNTAQDDTKDESQTVQTGKTEDKKDEAKTEEKSDETKTKTKTDDKTSTDSKTEDKTNETKPVTSSTNTTTAKPSGSAGTSKPPASTSTSKPAASAPESKPAQSKPAASAPAETKPAEPAKPTAAQASGYVGSSASALESALGAPISKSYSPSCMGEGEDGIWTYDGFTVYTYKEGGSETVEAVQ